jgi:hypothetical protein
MTYLPLLIAVLLIGLTLLVVGLRKNRQKDDR